MRQFLAAVKGEAGAGGIAQDIADAVSRIRDHPQWRKEYMLFELKMRDAKQEGLEEGLAKGLKQGREDGLKEGRAEERKEIAAVMIRGMSLMRRSLGIAGCH